MRKFKVAAKLLAASVTAITLAACASAAEVSDISGHWSENYVKYGIENGYINGYPDGTFLPDNPVTRAEFAKMMNSALGLTKSEEAEFFDIEEDKWYYPEVGKAVYAGYITGYEDGSFRATNQITRQEAAVILSRVATRPENLKTVDDFADSEDVASWAKQAFDYAFSKGFFGGDDLGNLNPKATLTRAQAAKILCELRNAENIYNGDYTITLNNAVCSETVFTDDIYFNADGTDPTLLLDGCTVLGTIYIRTGNDSVVTIDDSEIKNIFADSAFADINLKNGASAKQIRLEVPASVTGDGVKALILRGSDLASGTTKISASPDSVNVYSDAVIKAENLPKFIVSDGVSVTVQSGSIANMLVEKSASGSVITLSAGVEVENLTVNAASSFMGSGKIKNAENGVAGITYATKPEKVSGVTGSSDDEDEEIIVDENSFAPTSMSPGKNQKDVAVTVNPSIGFASRLYDADGNAVTAGYVEQNVQIRKNNSDGTKVYFSVDLTSSSKFTLDPDGGNFAPGVKYYIIIPAGVFTDADGKKNAKVSYYFITKDLEDDDDDSTGSGSSTTTSKTITYSPKNDEKNVAVSKNITVTFSSAIRRQNGDEVDAKYLENEAFELRKDSKSGDEVDFTATINSSKRTVTINPDEDLKAGVEYFVVIKSGKLEYSDGTNILSQYSCFTTKDSIGITTTPGHNTSGVALDSEIVIKFDCEIFADDGSKLTESDIEDVVSLKTGSSGSSGKLVDFDAEISDDKKSITITPKANLTSGTRYYIVIPAGVVTNKNGTENTSLTNYFETISQMQPAISPTGDNVSEDEIVISFSEPVYKNSKEAPVDADYIKELIEDGYITLCRKNYTSNLLENPKKVEISDDLKTITIVGGASLVSGRTYVVTVTSGKFWNNTGNKKNISATGTFSTLISGSPDVTPTKMTDGLAAADTSIEITFDSAMKTSSGANLTSSYIQDKVVTLYKDSEDGESIGFTASISTDKKTITVKPKAKLEGSTTYYVVINGQTMLNSNDEYNGGYSYSFVTDETVVAGCEFTPANRDVDVPVNTDITIEFNSALYRKGGRTGGSVNEEYLISNDVITLKDKNSNAVEFDVALSDDCKVITLTPKEPLELNKLYYVNVLSGDLYYFDGTLAKSYSASFTTVKVVPSIEEPVVSDITDKEAVVTVNAAEDGNLTLSYITGNKETVFVDGAILKNGQSKEWKISGLESDTKYTVKAVFVDNSGNETEKTVAFETEESKVVALKLTNIGVDVDGDDEADYGKANPGDEISFTISESTESIKLTTTASKAADITLKCVVVEDDEEKDVTVKGGKFSVESGKNYVITVTAVSEEDETETVSCTIKMTIN